MQHALTLKKTYINRCYVVMWVYFPTWCYCNQSPLPEVHCKPNTGHWPLQKQRILLQYDWARKWEASSNPCAHQQEGLLQGAWWSWEIATQASPSHSGWHILWFPMIAGFCISGNELHADLGHPFSPKRSVPEQTNLSCTCSHNMTGFAWI